MIYLQFIFELSPDRGIQLRRRLCGPSAHPPSGGGGKWLASVVRIYGSHHHFPDDTWSHCRQFGNVRRVKSGRNSGSSGMYAGMCAPVLYSGVADRKAVYLKYRSHGSAAGRVLKGLRPAVVALIATAGVDIMLAALNMLVGEGRVKLQMAVIFAICLVLLRKKWNPILVMVLAGVMQAGYWYIGLWLGVI